MTSKNIKSINNLKKIVKSYPLVDDIILFGSVVRGKEKPADTDILVIFQEKVDKNVEYLIRKELEKVYLNLSIVSKTKQTLMDPSFDARESFLFEGVSLLTKEKSAEDYGFSSYGLFKYDFKQWDKLKKTKFYYAFNGRAGSKGFSQQLGCIKLSDRIILVPLDKIEAMRTFLESWELPYNYVPTLIPQRLSKKELLEQ